MQSPDTDAGASPGGARPPSRVAVAINPPGDYTDVLDAAARLAACLEAQLEAVLVEDPGLLDVARLPFTRALDSSGREHELDDRAVQRAWQAERRRVDAEMRRCTARLNIRSTLRTVQGRFLTEALLVAAQVDVTMLVQTRPLARDLSSVERGWLRARPGGRARPAETRRRPRPVWVLFDGSAASRRALELGSQLAAGYGCGLLVVLPDGERGPGLLASVKELLGHARVPVTYVPVSGTAGQVLTALRRPEGCALALVPREAVDAQSMPTVVDALARQLCPLILVA